jgi:hypothetical protein
LEQSTGIPVPIGSEGAYFLIDDIKARYLIPDDNVMDARRYFRDELSLGKRSVEYYYEIYQEIIDLYICDG